jgi:hypothetical protein
MGVAVAEYHDLLCRDSNLLREPAVSTAASHADRQRDAQVRIRDLLKEREAKTEQYRTRSNIDEPTSSAVGPDGTILVTMRSGMVWKKGPIAANWSSAGPPLPDSSKREEYDEIMAINRELSELGHKEAV